MYSIFDNKADLTAQGNTNGTTLQTFAVLTVLKTKALNPITL